MLSSEFSSQFRYPSKSEIISEGKRPASAIPFATSTILGVPFDTIPSIADNADCAESSVTIESISSSYRTRFWIASDVSLPILKSCVALDNVSRRFASAEAEF